jgi:hypothetical protein
MSQGGFSSAGHAKTAQVIKKKHVSHVTKWAGQPNSYQPIERSSGEVRVSPFEITPFEVQEPGKEI